MDKYELYSPSRIPEHGFAVLQEAFSNKALEELRNHCHNLMSGDSKLGENDRVLGGTHKQLMRPEDVDEYFKGNEIIDKALAVYKEVFGLDETFNWSMLVVKGAESPSKVALHQDFAYSKEPSTDAGTKIDRTLQFWVPLIDTTEETGCLYYVPKRFRETVEHIVAAGDPYAPDRIIEAVGNFGDPISFPIKAGGFTMHLGGTIHGSDGNKGKLDRVAYIFNIGAY